MQQLDIIEDGANLIINIDLPGFAKSEINIRIVEDILSISAKRKVKANDGTVYYRHRPVTINRKIALPISPKDYEHEKLIGKATYVDGVVTLTIPSKNRVIWT
jgi:HSP20 family protein